MFTVKFLRHNPKNLSRTNRKQEYSFKKTFKNTTELIRYLDKAYPTVTVADCYEGMSPSDWYGYIQKKARMNQKSLEKAIVMYPDEDFIRDIYEDSLKGCNPENKYNRTTLNKLLNGNSKQKLPYKYYKKHNIK